MGQAEQSNSVSAFLDLTIVYGDDLTTLSGLRTGRSGLLRTNERDVLPVLRGCQTQPCYFLGDARLVQTPMLSQWHSLLLRLHNRIADALNNQNDELGFQEARRLTIAIFQRIVYNEWLPLVLGE